MNVFSYTCIKCNKKYQKGYKISGCRLSCLECSKNSIIEAPIVSIPSKHQSTPRKEKLNIPINVWEDLPDGRRKCTRYASTKAEAENPD